AVGRAVRRATCPQPLPLPSPGSRTAAAEPATRQQQPRRPVGGRRTDDLDSPQRPVPCARTPGRVMWIARAAISRTVSARIKPGEGSTMTNGTYPVQFSVEYPDGPLDRVTTLLRIFVAVPILIVLGGVSGGTWQWSTPE